MGLRNGTYKSCQQRADHVNGPHDQEGDAHVTLVGPRFVLHVQLEEGFEGGLGSKLSIFLPHQMGLKYVSNFELLNEFEPLYTVSLVQI